MGPERRSSDPGQARVEGGQSTRTQARQQSHTHAHSQTKVDGQLRNGRVFDWMEGTQTQTGRGSREESTMVSSYPFPSRALASSSRTANWVLRARDWTIGSYPVRARSPHKAPAKRKPWSKSCGRSGSRGGGGGGESQNPSRSPMHRRIRLARRTPRYENPGSGHIVAPWRRDLPKSGEEGNKQWLPALQSVRLAKRPESRQSW